MAALDLMEAEWRSENDPQGLSSSSLYSLTYSSWLSYGASLVTNIVQNIQVYYYILFLNFMCDDNIFLSLFL